MSQSGHSICVLGSRAAGKTCFFASLWYLCERYEGSPFSAILCHDDSTSQHLVDNGRALSQGLLLPGSTAFTPLDGQFDYRGRYRINFRSCDVAGEDFLRDFSKVSTQSHSELIDFYQASDYILLLLDYDVDVCGHTVEQGRRLDALLNAVIYLNRDASASTPQKIGLVITKADLHAGGRTSRDAQELLQEKQGAFYQKVRDIQGEVPTFFLSSLGAGFGQSRHEAGDFAVTSADSATPSGPHPWGYEEIFDWVVSDIRRKERFKWSLYGGVGLALIMLLLIVYSFCIQRQRQRTESIDHRLQVIKSELTSTRSIDWLEETYASMRQLEAMTLGQRETRDFLLQEVVRCLEECYYGNIKNTTDLEKQRRLLDAYLNDTRFSRYHKKCLDLMKLQKQKERNRCFADICRMPAGTVGEIKNKLQRILGVINDPHYFSPQRREDFFRLNDALKVVLEDSTFRCDIRCAKPLSEEADNVLKITTNGLSAPVETDEKSNSREPVWHGVELYIPAETHETLDIEWWDYTRVNEQIAQGEIKGILAFLESLSKGVHLTPCEGKETYFQDDKAVLKIVPERCTWPDDAQQLMERFLVPGTEWRNND